MNQETATTNTVTPYEDILERYTVERSKNRTLSTVLDEALLREREANKVINIFSKAVLERFAKHLAGDDIQNIPLADVLSRVGDLLDERTTLKEKLTAVEQSLQVVDDDEDDTITVLKLPAIATDLIIVGDEAVLASETKAFIAAGGSIKTNGHVLTLIDDDEKGVSIVELGLLVKEIQKQDKECIGIPILTSRKDFASTSEVRKLKAVTGGEVLVDRREHNGGVELLKQSMADHYEHDPKDDH